MDDHTPNCKQRCESLERQILRERERATLLEQRALALEAALRRSYRMVISPRRVDEDA